jgi:hypothetical protein
LTADLGTKSRNPAPAVSGTRASNPHHRGANRLASVCTSRERPTTSCRRRSRRAGLYRELWQSFCVLPDIRTVGVQGDQHTYGHVVVLRAVTSDDAMTADWAHLPYELLETTSSRMINELQAPSTSAGVLRPTRRVGRVSHNRSATSSRSRSQRGFGKTQASAAAAICATSHGAH